MPDTSTMVLGFMSFFFIQPLIFFSFFFWFFIEFIDFLSGFNNRVLEGYFFDIVQLFVNPLLGILILPMLVFCGLVYFGHGASFSLPLFFTAAGTAEVLILGFECEPFNSGLLNGLLLVHPIFLFCMYIFFIIFFFDWYYLNLFRFPSYTQNKFILRFCFFFSVIAILLGSVWAQQELNWGGWWSWDLVEVGSLVLLSIALVYMHKRFFYFRVYRIRAVYFFIFLFFYLGLRLSFFSSIHAFINSEASLTDSQVYLYLLAGLAVSFLFLRISQNYLFCLLYIFLFLLLWKDFILFYFSLDVEVVFLRIFYCFFFMFLFRISFFYSVTCIMLFPFASKALLIFWFFKLRGFLYHFLWMLTLLVCALLKINYYVEPTALSSLFKGVCDTEHFFFIFNSATTFFTWNICWILGLYYPVFCDISLDSFVEPTESLTDTTFVNNSIFFKYGIFFLSNITLTTFSIIPSLSVVYFFIIKK